MARVSELSVEEVEHFFKLAKTEVEESDLGDYAQTMEVSTGLEILERLEARLVAQMGFPKNGEQ